jgi:hypothetical protein
MRITMIEDISEVQTRKTVEVINELKCRLFGKYQFN